MIHQRKKKRTKTNYLITGRAGKTDHDVVHSTRLTTLSVNVLGVFCLYGYLLHISILFHPPSMKIAVNYLLMTSFAIKCLTSTQTKQLNKSDKFTMNTPQ